MTVAEIKKLPSEFDFISKINSSRIIYHAKEQLHNFVVTAEGGQEWTFEKNEFRRHFFKGEYVLCT